ncbi:MAG: hypothetical protein ACO4B4_11165 [Planctomycetota bacterium]
MSLHAGIEIDGSQVRVTVIDGSPKKYRVVDFVEGRITGETEDERRDSLRELLAPVLLGKDRRGLDVGISLGADRAILREINVPFTKDDVIAKTIRFESESHIHAHSVEDLLIEYIKTSESESGSRLILCCVDKERFGEELERLQSLPIDPARAELNVTALATSFSRLAGGGEDEHALLVQIEREHTTFVLMEGRRIIKVRSVWNVVHGGGAPSNLLTDAVVEDGGAAEDSTGEASIESRFAEIERSLGGVGDGSEDEPLDPDTPMFAVVSDDEFAAMGEGEPGEEAPRRTLALAPVGDPFDRIVLELERTFAGYLLGGTIDRLVVTGAEAATMDAARRLSDQFETEAETLSLEEVDCSIESTDRSAFLRGGAVSLGLALRGLGVAEIPFELRRDEFRFERRFERLMPSLALASLLLACVSLVWMVSVSREKESLSQELRIVQARSLQSYKEFFGKDPRSGSSTRDFLRASRDELKALQGRGGSRRNARMKNFLGGLDVLNDFFGAVEQARPPIYPVYTDFDMKPERKKNTKSTITLNAASNEEAMALVESIRANSAHFNVEQRLDRKDDGFKVTLDLTYKKDE